MSVKKIPMRMCVGCGEMKPKSELIRIVRDISGGVTIDRGGKASGRGAYLCDNILCFERAVKTRRAEKTLKVKIPVGLYDELKDGIKRE